MTGPEHYLEAERLLRQVSAMDGTVDASDTATVISAGVHAMLAVAAATALPGSHGPTEYTQARQGPGWVSVAEAYYERGGS